MTATEKTTATPTATTIGWLKFACIVTGGFGLLMVLAASPVTAAPASFLLDLVFWPIDGSETTEAHEFRLVAAILGGVMVGWAVLFWQIVTRLYPRDPRLARQMITWSILSWFVLDSTGSIIAGAPLNAVFNIGFLALFLLPLRQRQQTPPA
ncbi:MAG: hypothetical protein V3V30_09785 [Parvularculaceae bacterium]